MAYRLIPGVRQDHRGRTYQLGVYPNGKVINVPAAADATNLERGEHIIVPEHQQHITKVRPIMKLKPTEIAKRKAVVEYRHSGENTVFRRAYDTNETAQTIVDLVLRPLMRFDGKEWHVVFPSGMDYYAQYHIDGE